MKDSCWSSCTGLAGKNAERERGAHDEVDDGHPRVAVVDVVSKAGRVNHGELDLELLLLELSLDDVCGRGGSLARLFAEALLSIHGPGNSTEEQEVRCKRGATRRRREGLTNLGRLVHLLHEPVRVVLDSRQLSRKESVAAAPHLVSSHPSCFPPVRPANAPRQLRTDTSKHQRPPTRLSRQLT